MNDPGYQNNGNGGTNEPGFIAYSSDYGPVSYESNYNGYMQSYPVYSSGRSVGSYISAPPSALGCYYQSPPHAPMDFVPATFYQIPPPLPPQPPAPQISPGFNYTMMQQSRSSDNLTFANCPLSPVGALPRSNVPFHPNIPATWVSSNTSSVEETSSRASSKSRSRRRKKKKQLVAVPMKQQPLNDEADVAPLNISSSSSIATQNSPNDVRRDSRDAASSTSAHESLRYACITCIDAKTQTDFPSPLADHTLSQYSVLYRGVSRSNSLRSNQLVAARYAKIVTTSDDELGPDSDSGYSSPKARLTRLMSTNGQVTTCSVATTASPLAYASCSSTKYESAINRRKKRVRRKQSTLTGDNVDCAVQSDEDDDAMPKTEESEFEPHIPPAATAAAMAPAPAVDDDFPALDAQTDVREKATERMTLGACLQADNTSHGTNSWGQNQKARAEVTVHKSASEVALPSMAAEVVSPTAGPLLSYSKVLTSEYKPQPVRQPANKPSTPHPDRKIKNLDKNSIKARSGAGETERTPIRVSATVSQSLKSSKNKPTSIIPLTAFLPTQKAATGTGLLSEVSSSKQSAGSMPAPQKTPSRTSAEHEEPHQLPKRGKEKPNKPKKPSLMKKIILGERDKRKQERMELLTNNQTPARMMSGESMGSMPLALEAKMRDLDLGLESCPENLGVTGAMGGPAVDDDSHVSESEGDGMSGYESSNVCTSMNELSSSRPPSSLNLLSLPDMSSDGGGAASDCVSLRLHPIARDYILPKIHSRRFREYCDQVVSKEVNNACHELLQKLCYFQERATAKCEPTKMKSKRRIVLGLREVRKHLSLNHLKLIIFSPNMEKISSKGGLDEIMDELIDLARSVGTPFVFALTRKELGRAIKKCTPTSCVGVFSYQGAENLFENLMTLTESARLMYRDLVVEYQKEIQDEVTDPNARLYHEVPSDCSLGQSSCQESAVPFSQFATDVAVSETPPGSAEQPQELNGFPRVHHEMTLSICISDKSKP